MHTDLFAINYISRGSAPPPLRGSALLRCSAPLQCVAVMRCCCALLLQIVFLY